MSRIEDAKHGVELVKTLFDLACAIYDRLKVRATEKTERRVRELEAEIAALKAEQHL